MNAVIVLSCGGSSCGKGLAPPLNVNALVVGEVEVANLHPDLSQGLEQVGSAVVVQDDLVQVFELLFLKDFELLKLALWQEALQGLTDLTLDADRHVLLYEVLDHGEMVGVVLRVVPEVMDVLLDPPDLFLEARFVLLLVLAVIDLTLLGLKTLLEVLERALASQDELLDELNLLVDLEQPQFRLGVLGPVLADLCNQLALVLVVTLKEAVLPLKLPLRVRDQILIELLEDAIEVLERLALLLLLKLHLLQALLQQPLLSFDLLLALDALSVDVLDFFEDAIEEGHAACDFVSIEDDVLEAVNRVG